MHLEHSTLSGWMKVLCLKGWSKTGKVVHMSWPTGKHFQIVLSGTFYLILYCSQNRDVPIYVFKQETEEYHR